MEEHIYLDFNASTPIRPSVVEAMNQALQHYGNPSSVHKFGRAARNCIETARDTLAENLGVKPWQIIFTSGGTEANNLAIKAAVEGGQQILMSAVEHESIERSAANAIEIMVNKDGRLNLQALEMTLSKIPEGAGLVAVMLANNETGILQPIKEVIELCKRYKAKVHCDAVTAFTKIPFNYADLGADFISLSSHKIGGPKGVGALVIPHDQQLPACMHGGGQEKGHRAGTENMVGIVGFAQAVKEAAAESWDAVEAMRDAMEATILERAPKVPIYGKGVPRLPNTSCIGMPGVSTVKQLMVFDLDGFAVSAGSACSSGKVTPSHVLKAMGVGEGASAEALRVSLGWCSTAKEIEQFTKAWQRLYRRFKDER